MCDFLVLPRLLCLFFLARPFAWFGDGIWKKVECWGVGRKRALIFLFVGLIRRPNKVE
jgi:hypothetical protein